MSGLNEEPRALESDAGRAFIERSRKYLRDDYFVRIRMAVAKLSPADLWWRPNESSNSVGNLLLHLAGNARQWIVSGVGGQPDVRRRQQEFDAREGLDALAADVRLQIGSIAIRAAPKLPPTTGERIADNRAQTFADSVMYREALAAAADARGWAVHRYEREHVFRDAATALGLEDIDAFLRAMGRSVGPPWQAKHKLAAAAALAFTPAALRAPRETAPPLHR